ncbi:MAG: hypothetical protein IPL28_11685 [Chloroflexi bacterium]|nr:hypothetical protein [Chloroflexota bacterium]
MTTASAPAKLSYLANTLWSTASQPLPPQCRKCATAVIYPGPTLASSSPPPILAKTCGGTKPAPPILAAAVHAFASQLTSPNKTNPSAT